MACRTGRTGFTVWVDANRVRRICRLITRGRDWDVVECPLCELFHVCPAPVRGRYYPRRAA